VPKEGLEPSHPKAQEPKSCVSANSTTPAVKSAQSYDSAVEGEPCRTREAQRLTDSARRPLEVGWCSRR
jgi:hypothetical protein